MVATGRKWEGLLHIERNGITLEDGEDRVAVAAPHSICLLQGFSWRAAKGCPVGLCMDAIDKGEPFLREDGSEVRPTRINGHANVECARYTPSDTSHVRPDAITSPLPETLIGFYVEDHRFHTGAITDLDDNVRFGFEVAPFGNTPGMELHAVTSQDLHPAVNTGGAVNCQGTLGIPKTLPLGTIPVGAVIGLHVKCIDVWRDGFQISHHIFDGIFG